MSSQDFFVEIYELETNKVANRMGPHSESRANRIADGASINLNHERFAVRVVDEEGNEV